MEIKTVVYNSAPEWNMLHNKTINYLKDSDEQISQGLAKRLYKYALGTLDSAGFKEVVKDWEIEVYTTSGYDAPSERVYCVRWTNFNGGYIEVVGIFTSRGWPFLDHGLEIGR